MLRALLGVWFGLLVAPLLAHAGVVLDFAGAVLQVPIDDLATAIQAGDAITGTFTFDPASLDLIPASSSGSYLSTGPVFGMTVIIGGISFSEGGALDIGILNGLVDQYAVTASTPMVLLELFLQDNNGTAFNSDALP